jgi:hypothetical protein
MTVRVEGLTRDAAGLRRMERRGRRGKDDLRISGIAFRAFGLLRRTRDLPTPSQSHSDRIAHLLMVLDAATAVESGYFGTQTGQGSYWCTACDVSPCLLLSRFLEGRASDWHWRCRQPDRAFHMCKSESPPSAVITPVTASYVLSCTRY